MRKVFRVAIVCGLTLIVLGPARADDNAEARALLEKAIHAQGGEEQLAKLNISTMKLKGTVHVQSMAIAFTGDVASHGADRQRVVLEFEIGGQRITFMNVVNRDQGWSKINDTTVDMDKDKLTDTKEEAYASWVASLVPLKDKAFTLAPLGEIKVEDRPALGIRVAHKDHRDVNLYFDKKTHLLVKTESRVKDEASGQQVTQETFFSAYDEKGAVRQAMKLSVKRDGKLFLEAELLEIKAVDKLDDSLFAKP